MTQADRRPPLPPAKRTLNGSSAPTTVRPLAPPGGIGPPALPLLVLVATTVVAVALLALAGGTANADVSNAYVAGWIVGGIAGLGAFHWFRSTNARRATGPAYVIPAWRPNAVAVGLALVGWAVSIAHALAIADAVARR